MFRPAALLHPLTQVRFMLTAAIADNDSLDESFMNVQWSQMQPGTSLLSGIYSGPDVNSMRKL